MIRTLPRSQPLRQPPLQQAHEMPVSHPIRHPVPMQDYRDAHQEKGGKLKSMHEHASATHHDDIEAQGAHIDAIEAFAAQAPSAGAPRRASLADSLGDAPATGTHLHERHGLARVR